MKKFLSCNHIKQEKLLLLVFVQRGNYFYISVMDDLAGIVITKIRTWRP